MKHLTKAAIAATVAALLASLFATAAAAGPAHDMDHRRHELAEEDSKGGHDGGMGGCRMMRQGAEHKMGGGMMMDDRDFAHLKTELKITIVFCFIITLLFSFNNKCRHHAAAGGDVG